MTLMSFNAESVKSKFNKESEPPQGEGWSIWLESMYLGPDILGSVRPVHHYIAFRDPNGMLVDELHGLSIDRESSETQPLSLNLSDQIVVEVELHLAEEMDLDVAMKKQIFSGDAEQFLNHVFQAVDAGRFIIQQNLTYVVTPTGSIGQNSNSVAATLVQAMGLKFPEDSKKLWDPGVDQILLPSNWVSNYHDAEFKCANDLDVHALSVLASHVLTMNDELTFYDNREDVVEFMGKERIYFDREMPNPNYEPFGLDSVPFYWDGDTLEELIGRSGIEFSCKAADTNSTYDIVPLAPKL